MVTQRHALFGLGLARTLHVLGHTSLVSCSNAMCVPLRMHVHRHQSACSACQLGAAAVDQGVWRSSCLQTQARHLCADCVYHHRTCDAKISLLEAGRELDKVWLHVDMDAFYAR